MKSANLLTEEPGNIPVIALVGRPNVGKSTLFNVFTQSRDALVANFSGLTRDRQYGTAVIEGRSCLLIDTGGITDSKLQSKKNDENANSVDKLVIDQSVAAIDEADIVLFILDCQTGLSSEDFTLANQLRKQARQVLLVANKIDGKDPNQIISEFHQLGMGDIYPTTASQRGGLKPLLEKISELLPKLIKNDQQDQDVALRQKRTKIAIVGRPNVGKSTLINRILGEERVITCDLPGTTRDSIYIDYDHFSNDPDNPEALRHYTLIDTAGIRRRKNINLSIEKFSIVKTLDAIKQANVVVLITDGQEGIVDQDLHLMGTIIESGTALVLAINKWDGLTTEFKQQFKDDLQRRLHFADFFEIHYISALHGSGVGKLYDAIDKAYNNAIATLKTNKLTELLREATKRHQPPIIRGHRIKLRYAHAGGQNPPTIIIHGNQVEEVPAHYCRYLERFFRENLQLEGTPLKLYFRSGDNPFKDRKNTLTKRQVDKKRRLMRHKRSSK